MDQDLRGGHAGEQLAVRHGCNAGGSGPAGAGGDPRPDPGAPAVVDPYRVFLDETRRAERRTLGGADPGPRPLEVRPRRGRPRLVRPAIARALAVHPSTVRRIRRRFVAEGLEAALERRRPDRVDERRLDERQVAHLVALACSAPPDGHARWSLRLLADELVRASGSRLPAHRRPDLL